MDSVLNKVEEAIKTAEPKIESAVRSTLGDAAADKVHAGAEKLTEALHDPAKREKINEAVTKAQAKVKELANAKPAE